MQPCISAYRLPQKRFAPPYDKVVDRVQKRSSGFWRHGKEVSVSIDRLKLAYIPKEPEKFPVDSVNLKEKECFFNQRKFKSRKQKSREESSSRQETTTRSRPHNTF
ncbi:hypothetical protein TNCV_2814531 [Trichonephila clavipes]|nr:hypothetical protein TNCV_2814531 [Trichonephila clavipes]